MMGDIVTQCPESTRELENRMHAMHPLRKDNIYQTFGGQNDEAMNEYFYGVLSVPMPNKFFEEAESISQPAGLAWRYNLSSKATLVCAIGYTSDPGVPAVCEVDLSYDDEIIYVRRYEWKYENGGATKDAIDYCRQMFPDIPDTRWDCAPYVYRSIGRNPMRGREEDLIPITKGSVGADELADVAKTMYDETVRELMACFEQRNNGKIAIVADEYNLRKTLDDAERIKKKYGSNKVLLFDDGYEKEYASYSGDKYYERVSKMADVAHRIMSGELAPDLFDKLPLKKDGTFKVDQTIVLFDGKISDAFSTGDYVSGSKMCLGIVTGDDSWSSNKGRVNTSSNLGRLAIVSLRTSRKLYPLLNEELEVQDIQTKTTYLKQEEVKAGSVYAEKSGTKQIYLGSYEYTDWRQTTETFYVYARYTMKNARIASECEDLKEFCEKLSGALSCRRAPRKFVSLVESPFEKMELEKSELRASERR